MEVEAGWHSRPILYEPLCAWCPQGELTTSLPLRAPEAPTHMEWSRDCYVVPWGGRGTMLCRLKPTEQSKVQRIKVQLARRAALEIPIKSTGMGKPGQWQVEQGNTSEIQGNSDLGKSMEVNS